MMQSASTSAPAANPTTTHLPASVLENLAARFRPGGHPTPMPAPGVYARHNAVDTPGLLPDGTPSEVTVPRILTLRGDEHSPAPVADDVAELERGPQS